MPMYNDELDTLYMTGNPIGSMSNMKFTPNSDEVMANVASRLPSNDTLMNEALNYAVPSSVNFGNVAKGLFGKAITGNKAAALRSGDTLPYDRVFMESTGTFNPVQSLPINRVFNASTGKFVPVVNANEQAVINGIRNAGLIGSGLGVAGGLMLNNTANTPTQQPNVEATVKSLSPYLNVPLPTQEQLQQVNTEQRTRIPNIALDTSKIPDGNSTVNTANFGSANDGSWSYVKGGVRKGNTIAEDHNNPLNETIRGRTKNGGRSDFKVYNTLEDGIRGNWGLLQRYQDQHGLNTMRDIAARWSGAKGKHLDEYLSVVAKHSGLNPDEKLDLHNPEIASKLMYGMAYMESHKNAKKNLSIDKIYNVMSGSMPTSTTNAVNQVNAQITPQIGTRQQTTQIPELTTSPFASRKTPRRPMYNIPIEDDLFNTSDSLIKWTRR